MRDHVFRALATSAVMGFGCTLVSLALAACGGESNDGNGTPPPGPPPDAGVQLGTMNAPVVSNMTEALADAGIDISNLPPLESLDRRARGAVMRSFSESLGVTCEGCHAGGKPLPDGGTGLDFKAPTRNKAIAVRMWNEMSKPFTLSENRTLYCDSCHQGKSKFLDRSDTQALGAWMSTNFVHGLQKKDGAELTCATCHGSPLVGRFLEP